MDCQNISKLGQHDEGREAALEEALVQAYVIVLKNGHELKTPLTIMNGVISLMKIKFGNENSSEVELMLGKLSNEIKRMSTLIDESSSKIAHHVPEDLLVKARALR